MTFTTTTILSLLLLSLPSITIAGPCQPNEISVGISATWQQSGPFSTTYEYEATLWSNDCITIDTAPNSGNDFCVSGWEGGSVVNCAPNGGVWNVENGGSTFGSYPENTNDGCYIPGGNGLCAEFVDGFDEVSWCCPRL